MRGWGLRREDMLSMDRPLESPGSGDEAGEFRVECGRDVIG